MVIEYELTGAVISPCNKCCYDDNKDNDDPNPGAAAAPGLNF
jgi:hypothetical protein